MSRIPNLHIRDARWDKMRDAVTLPAGGFELVISIDALETQANRSLSPEEAVETVADEKALFAAVANTLAPQDGVITITKGILSSRSWSCEPYESEEE